VDNESRESSEKGDVTDIGKDESEIERVVFGR